MNKYKVLLSNTGVVYTMVDAIGYTLDGEWFFFGNSCKHDELKKNPSAQIKKENVISIQVIEQNGVKLNE